MMPDPVPPDVPELAPMVTTLGEAFCAAAVTALTLSGLLMITGVYWVVAVPDADAAVFHIDVAPAATPPPRPPAATRQAT